MSFDVAAEAYDRFMGRYSVQLAAPFADFAGIRAGQRALDVGCGPGALTAELVRRLGATAVAAVDPSEPFVAEARRRNPGVDVRLAAAEELPFAESTFDAVLAQLVVHFVREPVAAIVEMARVTRPGGAVAACVWDLAGGRAPISVFWRAARDVGGRADDESRRAGARAGHLAELFAEAGLRDVDEIELSSSVAFESFDDWWTPFTLGVGPAGAHARRLGAAELAVLRDRCRALLPGAPFTVHAVAWAARGRV